MTMGLSDKAQALLVAVSAGLMTFGTAAATIPSFVPDNIRVPVAVVAWLAGVVGFSLKEALGGQAPAASTKSA
jgi:hypothetical protein